MHVYISIPLFLATRGQLNTLQKSPKFVIFFLKWWRFRNRNRNLNGLFQLIIDTYLVNRASVFVLGVTRDLRKIFAYLDRDLDFF